ncbi:MAG TPA: sigma 54-interacting transcriptional regulator [Polyangiaceae bacterium]|nr:sigma 54-interacting transcriptional regulator [Polyangiaceae bacterium]
MSGNNDRSSRSVETVGASPLRELYEEASSPTLVVAFPRPCAAALPATAEPIGRDWLETLGIDDTLASRSHAVFSKRGGVCHVEDVGARNGTFVDGHRIPPGEKTALRDGSVVRIGRTLLVYRERGRGDVAPADPMGGMVGPYGLRPFRSAVTSLAQRNVINVLVQGETGTGKELAARFIAEQLRPGRTFLPVNVAAVSPDLFESQMFGHIAGAFTGARNTSPGFVRECEGGCIFLDELGELPRSLQPKLLRVIENREVIPVGTAQPTKVDVIVIAATNRDLAKGGAPWGFRKDLRARFLAGTITLPPLRERREDIFAIVQELSRKAGVQLNPETAEIEAVEFLMTLELQSNVRELESIVTRALAETPGGELLLRAVEKAAGGVKQSASQVLTEGIVNDALARHEGNKVRAARALGVPRGRLLRFLKGRTSE